MRDIKTDIKVSVKVFTQTAVSNIARESTKKVIKGLTESQKKLLEIRTKNMSDDQLEEYFDNNPYFKKALEDTIKSVNGIPSEKVSGSWVEKLKSNYEATYSKNLTKIFVWPAPRVVFSIIACIALLVITAFSIPDYLNNNKSDYMPVANFSNNITGLSVKFTDQSENAEEWKWDFGDGSNSTEQNPEHIYYEAGNYTVFLTAINTNGTNSTFTNITVIAPVAPEIIPIPPFANFISNVTRGYSPLSVQFTDLSENASEWNWDFGDRSNSTEQNPTHRYSAVGNYSVSLTATNTNGTDSRPVTIEVLNRPVPDDILPDTALPDIVLPVADFSSNVTQGKGPLAVLFTDFSKNAIERNWDFEDDGIVDSTDENVIYIYTAPGIYTVRLTTINEAGKNSKLATITVLPGTYTVPVAVNFEANVTSGYVPLTVQFKDASTGEVTKWNWDFGDGNRSTEQNPMHVYYTVGNYTVNLTAINVDGTDSKTITITVLEQPVTPIIHFYAYVTNRNSNTVSVINSTTNNVIATIPVGIAPWGVKVDQAGKKVYVANNGSSIVSVIDTVKYSTIANITVGNNPRKVAITPDRTKLYVTNWGSGNVSVIDTAKNNVTASVNVGVEPVGIAINPEGTRAYVANARNATISVIDTTTNTITATVTVGTAPGGVAVNPEGTRVYVSNWDSNNVSVINTSTNTVIANVTVGRAPEELIVTPDGKRYTWQIT